MTAVSKNWFKKVSFGYLFVSLSFLGNGWAKGLKLPPSPPLEIKLPQFERHTLSNGLQVLFLQNQEMPLVQGTLEVKAGSVLDPQGKEGLAGLTASLMRQGGAGQRSPEELDKAVEERAASLDAGAEREGAQASFKCLAEDLEPLLGLFADMLLRPSFNAQRLEIARQSTLDGLGHVEDTPDSLTQVLFVKSLYGHHAYGRWASPQSVAKLNREDVLAFYRKHWRPQGSVLSIAGKFDSAALLAKLESLLKDWKGGTGKPDFGQPKPLGPAIYFFPKQVSQVFVRLGFTGVARHDPREYSLAVANYVVGGSGFASRLMQQIRSDRGLAYFVYSFAAPADVPGIYEVEGGTRPQTLKEYLKLMFQILKDYAASGPSQQELDQAKQSMVEQFATQFESPFSEASYQASLDFHGYPQDYLATYRDKIKAVSLEQATQATRSLLSQQDWVMVVSGPAELKETLGEFGKVVEVKNVFEPLP